MKRLDFSELEQYLTKDIQPEDLAASLERLYFEYAELKLEFPDRVSPNDCENLGELRRLFLTLRNVKYLNIN